MQTKNDQNSGGKNESDFNVDRRIDDSGGGRKPGGRAGISGCRIGEFAAASVYRGNLYGGTFFQSVEKLDLQGIP